MFHPVCPRPMAVVGAAGHSFASNHQRAVLAGRLKEDSQGCQIRSDGGSRFLVVPVDAAIGKAQVEEPAWRS